MLGTLPRGLQAWPLGPTRRPAISVMTAAGAIRHWLVCWYTRGTRLSALGTAAQRLRATNLRSLRLNIGSVCYAKSAAEAEFMPLPVSIADAEGKFK